jgi:hypothetical protein
MVAYNIGAMFSNGITQNNNTQPQQPLCIDNHNLCYNPISVGGNYYCSLNDTLYCADSCNNTIINETLTGICSQGSQLPNECNIIGYQECDSSTSFKICGIWSTGSRLTYQSGFSCQINQVCRTGYCVNNNATGQTTQATFSVQPFTSDDDNTKYLLDNLNKIVHINTKNLVHNKKFSMTASPISTYTSRTCNYKETNIYTDATDYESIGYKQNILTIPISSTAYINILVTLPDNKNATIDFNSTIGTNIMHFNIVRNDTLNSVCVYNQTELIYCSYGINQYDFKGLNLTIIFDYGSNSYTSTLGFLRTQDEYIYNSPKLFTQNVGMIEVNGNNATQKSLTVNTFTQPNGYTGTLQNNYDFLPCLTSAIGCRDVRTYVNLDGLPTFTKYQDWNICLDSINNENPATPQNNNTTGGLFASLSMNTKYIIMLVSTIGLFLVIMFFGMASGSGQAGVTGGLVVAMVVCLTLSIIFGLSLIIPILFIILGGVAVAFLIRKGSTG